MIAVTFFLVALFYVTYIRSRPNASAASPNRRILTVSIILTLSFFLYSIRNVNHPPRVDYFATGWGPFIRDINAELAARGLPYKLPDPASWR
jgi:hypothetical protein